MIDHATLARFHSPLCRIRQPFRTGAPASGPRRSQRGLAAILAMATLVASCAPTPTPYQPFRPHSAGGIHGGYSEERLAADEFRVRFHGNSMTSRDRVEGYMLYRAAELTLQSGFDWFLVADRNTEHNVRTIVQPDPLYRPWFGPGYGAWRPDWRYYSQGQGWNTWYGHDGDPFWADRVDIRRIEAFEATADVLMRKGQMPVTELRAIDARRVIADLGPRVERPKG